MNEFAEELLAPTSQIALIMGVAEAAKSMGVDNRYIPLVDLILGLASGILVYYESYGLMRSIIIGLALGLSACGLFSGYKNLIKE